MSWVPPDRPPEDAPGPTPPPTPPTWAAAGGAPPPADPPAADPRPTRGGDGPRWQPVGPPASRRSGTVVVAVVVAVVVVFGLVLALGLLAADDEGDGDAEPAAPTQEPAEEPAEGDADPAPSEEEAADLAELEATVDELSRYVEEARGAPFPEDVTVELLDDDAFNEYLLAELEEGREDLELARRLYVALGLLEPDVDLYEVLRAFLGSGVLGLYNPETGELLVRGAAITPFTRSTIVHELVHAHDDQRFELHRPELEDADDESGIAFSSLLEGNAVRIQQAWEASLGTGEQMALLREQLAASGDVDVSELPGVLLEEIQFPYTAGASFAEAVAAEGGEAAIDAAFGAPPTTTEQIIDPATYLAGEGALEVAPPPADGEVVDQGAYGQLTLLLTLREELVLEVARAAAEGWGGDAYVAWEDGEAACVRATFAMDTPEDLDELTEAWTAWAEGKDGATVEPTAEAVTVTACG